MIWFKIFLLGLPLGCIAGMVLGLVMAFRKEK